MTDAPSIGVAMLGYAFMAKARSFEDGYRRGEVCDAIQHSAASGRKERIDR